MKMSVGSVVTFIGVMVSVTLILQEVLKAWGPSVEFPRQWVLAFAQSAGVFAAMVAQWPWVRQEPTRRIKTFIGWCGLSALANFVMLAMRVTLKIG